MTLSISFVYFGIILYLCQRILKQNIYAKRKGEEKRRPTPEKDKRTAEAFIRRHPHPQYNKYLDPRKFRRFAIENGNIVWGKNWDLIFPVEQLHDGMVV